MSEADLLRFASDALKFSGLIWWRVSNAPSVFNKGSQVCFRKSPIAGFPDLAGLTPSGQFWAVELKTPKGIVALHQKEWHEKLRSSCAIVDVIRTPEQMINFIASIGGKTKPQQKLRLCETISD